MIDYPCANFGESLLNSSFLATLGGFKLQSLHRLSLIFNMTIPHLLRMVSAPGHDARGNLTSNVDCKKFLLDLADLKWSPGRPLDGNGFVIDGFANSQPYGILGFICSILIVPVAILGIIGNIISAWFFGRLSAKSSINTMLMAMALFDCVLLLTGAPLYSLVGIHSYTGHDYLLQSMGSCLIYFYAISTMAQTATTWMLVLITIERFLAVCRPFLARRLCTVGRARKAVLCVTFFSVAYNIVRFWEFKSDKKTAARPFLRTNPYYRSIYMHWMYLVLIFLIPFAIIAFFNAIIIRTIKHARIGRRTCRVHVGARSSNSNGGHVTRVKSEYRTAAMLLVVVLVFMLCEVLAPVLNAWELSGYSIASPVFAFLSDLNNLLILLHSAVNVGIYIGFCSEYRRVCGLIISLLKRLFCCSPGPLSISQRESRNEISSVSRSDRSDRQRRAHSSIGSANGVNADGAAGESLPLTNMDENRPAIMIRTSSGHLIDESTRV